MDPDETMPGIVAPSSVVPSAISGAWTPLHRTRQGSWSPHGLPGFSNISRPQ